MESMETTESNKGDANNTVPEKKARANDYGIETRKIQVPRHRMAPLKENWLKIFNPVVEHLKLQIRFNLKTKNVEIRTGKDTKDISSIQKGKKNKEYNKE
jgi:RNA-binding protein PNO1